MKTGLEIEDFPFSAYFSRQGSPFEGRMVEVVGEAPPHPFNMPNGILGQSAPGCWLIRFIGQPANIPGEDMNTVAVSRYVVVRPGSLTRLEDKPEGVELRTCRRTHSELNN